jgi:hypothetical protein
LASYVTLYVAVLIFGICIALLALAMAVLAARRKETLSA